MGKALVLVAERDADTRALLRYIVELGGFDVVTAADEPAALAALTRDVPGIILANLMLPPEDGIQFIRRVRATPGFAETAILALVNGRDSREGAAEAGATEILMKPDDIPQLLETLNRLLPARGAARASAD